MFRITRKCCLSSPFRRRRSGRSMEIQIREEQLYGLIDVSVPLSAEAEGQYFKAKSPRSPPTMTSQFPFPPKRKVNHGINESRQQGGCCRVSVPLFPPPLKRKVNKAAILHDLALLYMESQFPFPPKRKVKWRLRIRSRLFSMV